MAAVENAPDRIRLWLVLAAWVGLRVKEIALLRTEKDPPSAGPAGPAGRGGRDEGQQ